MRRPAAVILMFLCLVSWAQVRRGGELFQIRNSDVFWAAVKTEYFQDFVASQEEDCWCWAACVQMVLNYQGIDVTQEDLVRRVKGRRINAAGNMSEIQKAADGWRVDGRTIRAKCDNPATLTAVSCISDLKNKYPLIIGLHMPGQEYGHAYVLTGVSFRKNGGAYQPIEVILRDPWPYNESRQKLSWSEFRRRLNTVVHVFPE